MLWKGPTCTPGDAYTLLLAHLCGALLSLEHLAVTTGAGVGVPLLPHDGLAVHPSLVLGLCLVAEAAGVAVPTVDLAVGAVEEGGGVESSVTLEAAHAVLVEGAGLGRDPLGLKHLALAADAGVGVVVLTLHLQMDGRGRQGVRYVIPCPYLQTCSCRRVPRTFCSTPR